MPDAHSLERIVTRVIVECAIAAAVLFRLARRLAQ